MPMTLRGLNGGPTHVTFDRCAGKEHRPAAAATRGMIIAQSGGSALVGYPRCQRFTKWLYCS